MNGLALLVEQSLGLDPFAPAVFIFSNRRRDRIKLLLWDRAGFWLMLKRLEADRFRWLKDTASTNSLWSNCTGCWQALTWRPHLERNYTKVLKQCRKDGKIGP
ncbi:MAG: IS66 family insertion sequence element accessory protein TnpB [Methylococcales bacterium]|nr:IS66 family insertion sequence element accessory protein TnpB [Methylococcales bacterium]